MEEKSVERPIAKSPEDLIPEPEGIVTAKRSPIYKNKFFLGFVGLSLLIAFLLGGFYIGRHQSKTCCAPSPIPTQPAQITTAPTSTSSSSETTSPTEAPLAGMKWYDAGGGFKFQVPSDYIKNNDSTSDFISFLAKETEIDNKLATRLVVQTVKTSDDLQTYLSKNNYDRDSIDGPIAHEPTTVDGHSAIAVTQTFQPDKTCGGNETGTAMIKRTNALLIQGKGTIYIFTTDDACSTVGNDWFSKIFPTIRIP